MFTDDTNGCYKTSSSDWPANDIVQLLKQVDRHSQVCSALKTESAVQSRLVCYLRDFFKYDFHSFKVIQTNSYDFYKQTIKGKI